MDRNETIDSHEGVHAQLEELVGRAEAGDLTALPDLRTALEEHPQLWQINGDLARTNQDIWLALLARKDLAVYESVRRKLAALTAELARPDPTWLETLLIECIRACLIRANAASYLVAQAAELQAPPALLRDLQRSEAKSLKRYVQSIKRLETIRRLL